jgi:hypothetical protein
MYADNAFRTIVVLNKKYVGNGGATFNAVCHALLGLEHQLRDASGPEVLNYDAKDGPLAVISRFPVIVLVSENSNQLRTLLEQCRSGGIPSNPFVAEMFGASAAEQMQATQAKPMAQLEFIAVAIYGSMEATRPLTKKFSMMRSALAVA